jgi:hypothetical protein|tara:strand:+ start:186 stop:1001 length:816 start_codon:yes stop_codon:yes gene_type:complete
MMISKEELKNNGVVYRKKIITIDEVESFKSILNKNNAVGKDNLNGFFSVSFNQLIKDFIKLRFRKAFYSIKLIKFTQKNKFKLIADSYFGEPSRLVKIDSYISKIDNEKIIDWHNDMAYSGEVNVQEKDLYDPNRASLKFFLFLTDVSQDNGDLAFIKKSSKITLALKQLFFSKKIKYEPHWKLRDFREIIKRKNIKDLIAKNSKIDLGQINEFIEYTNFIENNNDTYKFDNYTEKGDLMIFDENGFHRASPPLKKTRYVMRFIFCRESFV